MSENARYITITKIKKVCKINALQIHIAIKRYLSVILSLITRVKMDILDGLNEPQKEAVLQTEGPVLILAGAGSGKTRVITHRVAHLILEKKIHPLQICAVTFTNKAAAEMRERLEKLVPRESRYVTMKTFHSLCLQILRSHPELCQRKSGFTVYDTDLQESVVKETIKELSLDIKTFKPSQVANRLNSIKDSQFNPEEFILNNKRDLDRKQILEIYQSYEKKKVERNAVDFSDLIFLTVKVFREHPELVEKYNSRWKYIMVDEYQDTNKMQYELTKFLAGPTQNICVVGDDDQSIYSWRGADIRNILDFEKDYPNTFTVKLEQNYRSTSNIIQAASSVISNNKARKKKNIFSTQEKGSKICLVSYMSEQEEAKGVFEEVRKIYRNEKSYRKIAIFYRTNAQSRYFEEVMRTNNIPYKIFGGFRFFDRTEIKDLVAYLSVVVNPLDSTSLLRIINSPPRGIGDTTIEKLLSLSVERGESFLEVLSDPPEDLRKNTLRNVKELYTKFQELIEMNEKGEFPPSHIVHKVITDMQIDLHYRQEGSEESINRIENMSEFVNAVQEYETSSEEPSLAEYLGNISLITSEENNPELQDYITLMTVHNSKGLEFDYVFLTGMEEGTFPHAFSMESTHGLEEERRLAYVAITRAKKKLYISHNEATRKYGMLDFRSPSRFLNEIPEELIANSYQEEDYSPKAKPVAKPSAPPAAANRIDNPTLDEQKRSSTDTGELKVGSFVKHKTYGVGKITEMSGKGDNVKVKIAFGMVVKSFLLSYTTLELIK